MTEHIPTLHHIQAAMRELAAAERCTEKLSNDDQAYVSMRIQEAHREAKLAATYLVAKPHEQAT